VARKPTIQKTTFLKAPAPGRVQALLTLQEGQIVQLPLNQIDTDENQPRQHFGEEELQELADSIREKGLQQPIGVRPVGDRYRIIWGERRWRATTIVGLETIPSIVRDVDEGEAYELALIENLQRENLSPLEEAAGVEELIQRRKYNQQQAGQVLGKSKAHVSKLMTLAKLSQEVRSKVSTSKLGLDQLYQVASQKSQAEQLRLAERIITNALTVRETRKEAKKGKKPGTAPVQEGPPPLIQQLRRMRERFGREQLGKWTPTDKKLLQEEIAVWKEALEKLEKRL